MLFLISLLLSAPVSAGRASLHEAAREAYGAGRYAEAAEVYAQLRRPGQVVRIEAAWTQLQLQDPGAARGLLAPVLRKPSPPAEALVVGAIADLWRGRPVEAAAQARAALSSLPPDGPLYDLGARALIEALTDPGVCPARSYCLDELRERAVLLEGLSGRPGLGEDRPNVLLRLGDVAEDLATVTLLQAYEAYDAELDRCFTEPGCDAGSLEPELTDSRTWSEAALVRYEQVVVEHPASEEASWAMFSVGPVLLDLERDDEAYVWLEQAVRRFPESEGAEAARLLIAEHDLERGRLAAARDGYRAVLGGSYEPYVRYKLGWVLLEMGDHRGAIEEMVAVSRVPSVLKEEAARDTLWFYIAADDVDGAIGFVDAHADATAREALLRLLARRLEDGGLHQGVVTACGRLLQDAPLDEAAPGWLLSIAAAQQALGLEAAALSSRAALEAMVAPDSPWSRAGDPARASEGARVLARAGRLLGP